jgi:hypothetical protein
VILDQLLVTSNDEDIFICIVVALISGVKPAVSNGIGCLLS